MATPISGYSALERAKHTIYIINDHLQPKGTIRWPTGKSQQVRWSLRHDSLLPLVNRPGQHIVAAAFAAVPKRQLANKESFHGGPVTPNDVQVLVPVLGKALGLHQEDKFGTPLTYVTTTEEIVALAKAIAEAMP